MGTDSGERRAPKRLVPGEIGIDNFSFAPRAATVVAGHRLTWTNHDDVPHQIVSTDGRFPPSPVLDTGQRYVHAFAKPGEYAYFCSIHPTMTGKVVVS